MDSKKIKKAISYTVAMAALCAAMDLLISYGFKAWDYDTFKDHHYKMDALKAQRFINPANEMEIKENDLIEQKLNQVQKDHQKLQEPIQTIFFGKISNKCPICGGK